MFLGNSVGMPYILAYAHGRTRTGGGVHVSHDEGATWQVFDEGLEGSSHEVTTLAAAPDGTILLGMRLNVVKNRTETRFGGRVDSVEHDGDRDVRVDHPPHHLVVDGVHLAVELQAGHAVADVDQRGAPVAQHLAALQGLTAIGSSEAAAAIDALRLASSEMRPAVTPASKV